MTTLRDRLKDLHFLTVPRAAAALVFVIGIGSFLFFVHRPNTSPIYSHAYDRDSVLVVSGLVYNEVEDGSNRTGLPVPVAVTVAHMRTLYAGEGLRVHVFVHRANIKVTFPKGVAICVWVPAIVEGPKGPSIVAC